MKTGFTYSGDSDKWVIALLFLFVIALSIAYTKGMEQLAEQNNVLISQL